MDVFKFCKLDMWVIKNLYYSQLYFSEIENLNDAGECLFSVEDDVSESEDKKKDFLITARKIYTHNNLNFSEMFSHHLKKAENKGEGFKEVAAYIVGAVLEAYKTCSFTTRDGFLNPIMWGHYGNSSKGVCLHYEIDYEGLEHIKYISDENIEKIHISEINLDSLSGIAKRVFYKKNKDWSYEKEYRLIGGKNIVDVPRDCLQGIYFGVNVNISDAIFLMDIVKEKYNKVEWAVVFHPRLENRMRMHHFNNTEQLSKILNQKGKEDVFGTRYLVEERMRERLFRK